MTDDATAGRFFARSPLPSLICGPRAEVLAANDAAQALFRGPLVGRSLGELVDDATAGARERLWDACAADGGTGEFTGRLTVLAGAARVPVEVHASRLAAGDDLRVGLALRDIRPRLDAEEALRARARQHAVIAALGERAAAGADLSALAAAAAAGLSETLDVDHVAVWEARDDGSLGVRAAVGWPAALEAAPGGTGSHPGYVLERRRTVTMPDRRAEHRFDGAAGIAGDGIVSGLGTPIGGGDAPWGVLGVYARAHRDFKVHDGHLLQAVANLLGTAVARDRADAARREFEARLHRSERLETVGQLAGGVAHDFNNLLAVVLSCARFALDELPEGSEARDDIEQIVEASRRASELTRQLLIFSRRDQAEPSTVVLDEVLHPVQRMLGRAAGDAVDVELRLAGDLWPVRADPGRIEQVVLNLVVNARDAILTAGETGRVVVSTENVWLDDAAAALLPPLTAGPHVALAVTDDGPGLPPEVAARAFEPFFTTKEVGQGTGLGLATVYGIVEEARGHVGVTSQPGAGAVFRVLLRATESPAGAAADGVGAPDAPRGHGERVLLVEDEGLVREVLRRILAEGGYTVVAADDGDRALEVAAAADAPFDLLVTDLAMPRRSGAATSRALLARQPELRVLYLTAYSPEAAELPVDGAGRALRLSKPFHAAEVLRAAATALSEPPPTPE